GGTGSADRTGLHAASAAAGAPGQGHALKCGGSVTSGDADPPPSSECRPDQARSHRFYVIHNVSDRRETCRSSRRLRGSGPHFGRMRSVRHPQWR
nr:hypothetical protein [Tanacetum cinerariifolium]